MGLSPECRREGLLRKQTPTLLWQHAQGHCSLGGKPDPALNDTHLAVRLDLIDSISYDNTQNTIKTYRAGDSGVMATRKLPKVLTDEELRDLLRQVNVTGKTGLRNKAMLKVMAYGGLRVSEVVGLRTQDVRREGGRIVLEVRGGKGGRDRQVPLPDHAGETLQAWMAKRRDLGIGNGHVFCTVSKGRSIHPKASSEGLTDEVIETELIPDKAISTRYVQNLVPRLAEKAGIEKRVTPHVLRHTAATRTLREAGNIRRVQELLSHSDVSTTMIYTEVLAEDLAEAVDAVPDVEAAPKNEPSEAEKVAAEVLGALPVAVREALARLAASVTND